VQGPLRMFYNKSQRDLWYESGRPVPVVQITAETKSAWHYVQTPGQQKLLCISTCEIQ